MAGFSSRRHIFWRRQNLHFLQSIDRYLFDKIEIIILVCILHYFRKCLKNTELEMDFYRCLLAGFLLVFSGQSLALFMPDGFKVNTDQSVESEEGCGSIVREFKEFGAIR